MPNDVDIIAREIGKKKINACNQANKYIDENINSLNFEIEREDLNRLNEFRSKEVDSVEIDWNNEGGIPIHQLPNQFE